MRVVETNPSSAGGAGPDGTVGPGPSPGLRVGLTLLVAGVYFLAGKLGLAVAGIGNNIALIWPATGVALAMLIRVGRFTWPGIVVGDMAVALLGHVPLGAALGIATGHALGPLTAAAILRRAGFRDAPDRPRDALVFTGVAVAAMVLPASFGVSSLVATGLMSSADAAGSWLRWWVGDVVGTLIVAPAVLTSSVRRFRELHGSALLEFVGLTVFSAVCGVAAWTSSSPLPAAFLTLPPLIWAVLRFGAFGAALASLELAGFATWATAATLGPLSGFDLQTRLLLLTGYLATIALGQLLMASVLAARIDAERQLRRERLLLASVVDSASDGILAVGGDGRILVFNPSAGRILGLTDGEVVGRRLDDVLARSFGPDQLQALSRLADGGPAKAAVSSGEVQATRSDGTTFPLEVSFTRVAHDGQVLTTALLRDLTERKRAEADRAQLESELRQSQKMEAIGTLAGGVAHDFNNILGAILGNAELLDMDLPDGHAGRESLSQIVKASKRARTLVQQILTFSRQREGARQVASLEQVTQEALALIRPSLPSNVQLAVQFDPRCPTVLADPSQIHQVVLNLCTNALHAMRPDGGTLEVRVEPVVTGGNGQQARAAIVVRDSGVGMTRELRERIFEPFFTTRPTGEGTGLGLSVVHGIVRGHQGSIEVESEPGRGSTFRVHFPAAAPGKPLTASADAAVAPTGHGERVLFVDDEAPLVALGIRTLRRLGYEAEGCGSPEEAMAVLRRRPADFQLLVTDLSMPGKLGTALIAEARAIRPDLPVVLATGYGGSLATEQLQALGIHHVLSKPAPLLTFARVIRQALDDTSPGATAAVVPGTA